MKLKIIDIASHRNGVAGARFDVVLFREGKSRKLAILFDSPGQCAVLDIAKLAKGDIAFGSNSWRGDDYEPSLRAAITAHMGTGLAAITGEHEVAAGHDSPSYVHRLLAKRRQIAIIWSIEDVRGVRPHLNDDQAWEVLERCVELHDADWGFNYTHIETVADDMFPVKEEGDGQ